jgi:hypothetical protein
VEYRDIEEEFGHILLSKFSRIRSNSPKGEKHIFRENSGIKRDRFLLMAPLDSWEKGLQRRYLDQNCVTYIF